MTGSMTNWQPETPPGLATPPLGIVGDGSHPYLLKNKWVPAHGLAIW